MLSLSFGIIRFSGKVSNDLQVQIEVSLMMEVVRVVDDRMVQTIER